MGKPKEVGKRILSLKQQIFDSQLLYKNLKTKIEDLGYVFIEKEHERKDTKYGYELKFEFQGKKAYDNFCKADVSIKVSLENMNKIKFGDKDVEKGDGEIIISGTIETDYKKDWELSKFKAFIFKIYNKYLAGGKIKKLYIIPTAMDVEELNKTVKESLGFYYKY